jgi:hypothetical protein
MKILLNSFFEKLVHLWICFYFLCPWGFLEIFLLLNYICKIIESELNYLSLTFLAVILNIQFGKYPIFKSTFEAILIFAFYILNGIYSTIKNL